MPPPATQPPAAIAQPTQPHASMEWSPSPSPAPQPRLSTPSPQPDRPPLFPPRPQVYCIPASPPPLLPSFLLAPSFSPSLPPVRQFGHGSLNTPSDTLSFLPVLTFFLSLLILLLSLHAPRYSPSTPLVILLPRPSLFSFHAPRYSPSTPIQVLSRHAHPFSPANV